MKRNRQKIKSLVKKYKEIQKLCDPIEKEIRPLLKSEYPQLSSNEVIDWTCDFVTLKPDDVFSRLDKIFKK